VVTAHVAQELRASDREAIEFVLDGDEGLRDFVDQFANIIHDSGVNAKHLMIEITENVVMDSSSVAVEKMQELKDRTGVQLSLDDFGTGFSSLTYLKQCTLDELKIDRAFVQDLHLDENDALLAETILNVGLKFGLKVIAEGVELDKQVNFLSSKGCQHFQGFLFGKPVPAEEFEKNHLFK
jgi:EAL domain-containing protein (putative c-di-GMP-specific phosphodiesterase class I)